MDVVQLLGVNVRRYRRRGVFKASSEGRECRFCSWPRCYSGGLMLSAKAFRGSEAINGVIDPNPTQSWL